MMPFFISKCRKEQQHVAKVRHVQVCIWCNVNLNMVLAVAL